MAAQTTAAPASGSQSGPKASSGRTGEDSKTHAELESLEDVLAAELGELNDDADATDDPDPAGEEEESDAADDDATPDEEEESDDDAEPGDDEDESEHADTDPEGETEDDPSDDDAEGEDPKGLEKLPKGLRKRVKKLFQHDKAQKAEIAALQSQLDDLQKDPVALQPSRRHPLSDVRTAEDLAQRVEQARQVKQWCRRNPEGGKVTEDGKEVDIDAEGAQARLEWAERILDEAPNREKWLEQYGAAHRFSKEHFPELFRKDTPEYRAAQELLKQTPELATRPDYEAFIGHYITGLRMAIDRHNGVKWVRIAPKDAAKPAGKEPVKTSPKKAAAPPAQPVRHGAPPLRSVNGKKRVDFAALEKRAAEGDEEALAALAEAEYNA